MSDTSEHNPYDQIQDALSYSIISAEETPGGSHVNIPPYGHTQLEAETDRGRNLVSTIMTRSEALSAENERTGKALDDEAQSEDNKIAIALLNTKKVRQDLKSLEIDEKEAILKTLASRIENSICNNPELLQYLELGGMIKELGIPSRDDIQAAKKQLDDSKELILTTRYKSSVMRVEYNRLERENEQLKAGEQDQQALQGTVSSQGSERRGIALFAKGLGVELGEDQEQWPTDEIHAAIGMAEEIDAANITPQAWRWLRDLEATAPTRNDRSAMQQSFWLFAQTFEHDLSEISISLSDVQALVVKIQRANSLELSRSLAFLHQFVVKLAKGMLDTVRQNDFNENCAFIFLRCVELLALHLIPAMDTYKLAIRPIVMAVEDQLEGAKKGSKLLQGLDFYVSTLLRGMPNTTLKTSLFTSVSNDEKFDLGEYQLLPDGDNILMTVRETVHLIRPDQYQMDLSPANGFFIRVNDFPRVGEEWCSPFWDDLTPELEELFNFTLSRLEQRKYELVSLDQRVKKMALN